MSRLARVTSSEWRIMEREGYSGTFDVPANFSMSHRFPYIAGYFHFRSAGYSRKSSGALSTSSGMKLYDSGKCLFIVRIMAISASFVRAQCDHLRGLFVSVIVTVIINISIHWSFRFYSWWSASTSRTGRNARFVQIAVYFTNKVCTRAMQPYKSKKWLEQHFPGSWEWKTAALCNDKCQVPFLCTPEKFPFCMSDNYQST